MAVATGARAYTASRDELLRRFRRLSGQINGIAVMVEEERYCPEVLTQISAAIAALEKIGFILLRDHMKNCAADAMTRGEGEEYLDELLTVIHRFSGR
jgi:DNA-binding FrmR family transcriptional regulator